MISGHAMINVVSALRVNILDTTPLFLSNKVLETLKGRFTRYQKHRHME